MRLTHRRGEDRILTVPNGFTVIRLLCIPLFIWLLTLPNRSDGSRPPSCSAGWGSRMASTATWPAISTRSPLLGKVLDPTADRLLLGVAAVGIVVVGALPLGVAIATLSREALVALGFVIVALAGGRRMDVQWAGKAATFGLCFALPLFLIGHAPAVASPGGSAGVGGGDSSPGAGLVRGNHLHPEGPGRPIRRSPWARGGCPMKAVIMAGGEGTRLVRSPPTSPSR